MVNFNFIPPEAGPSQAKGQRVVSLLCGLGESQRLCVKLKLSRKGPSIHQGCGVLKLIKGNLQSDKAASAIPVMKRIRPILALLLFLSTQSPAQNFKQEFSKLCSQNDTAAQSKLLERWQKARPHDAELYVALFNYYFSKSRSEIVTISKEKKSGTLLELKDTGNHKTVGYLSGGYDHNNDLLKKGLQYIDSGISRYPARLDMRFGKIYVLGEIEDYEYFTNEIIRTVDFGATIHNEWIWPDSKEISKPGFFINTIRHYGLQLYDAGDEQLGRMRRVALAILKYNPDHVESLSDLAITYSLQGDDDRALEALLKAEKLAPHDFIVLNNIAHIYNNKGDKPRAIKYYELTLKYGDEEAKAQATEKLRTLKQ